VIFQGVEVAPSALHLAISSGKDLSAHFIVKHIIRNCGNIDIRDDLKKTPLLLAVELGYVGLAKHLYRGTDHKIIIFIYLLLRQLIIIYMFLDGKASLQVKDRFLKEGILHKAVRSGSTDVVAWACETLKSSGFLRINVKNKLGMSSVLLAASLSLRDIVLFLLCSGADPCARDENGNDVCCLAARNGDAKTLSAILRCNSSRGVQSLIDGIVKSANDGNISPLPLHAAVEADSIPCIMCLLEHGWDVNMCNRDGRTALMEACAGGCIKSVEYLIGNARVNLFMEDHLGLTPLALSILAGEIRAVDFLLQKDISVVTYINRSNENIMEAILKILAKNCKTVSIVLQFFPSLIAYGVAVTPKLIRRLASFNPSGVSILQALKFVLSFPTFDHLNVSKYPKSATFANFELPSFTVDWPHADYCDVVFCLHNDEFILAHSFIVAAMCEPFRAMLTSGILEVDENSRMRIKALHYTSEIFSPFVVWMYTGLDVSRRMPPPSVVELLILAHEYLALELMTLCEDTIGTVADHFPPDQISILCTTFNLKVLPRYLELNSKYKTYAHINPADLYSKVGDGDETRQFLFYWNCRETSALNNWYSDVCWLQLSLWSAIHDDTVIQYSSEAVRSAIIHLRSFPYSYIASFLMSLIGDKKSVPHYKTLEPYRVNEAASFEDNASVIKLAIMRGDFAFCRTEDRDNTSIEHLIVTVLSSLFCAPPFLSILHSNEENVRLKLLNPDPLLVICHRSHLLLAGNVKYFPLPQHYTSRNQVSYDLTIYSEDDPNIKFSAHRAILAAASDKFAASLKFSNDHFSPSCDLKVVRLQSMSSVCLGLLLWYIYTGHIINIEDYVPWFLKNIESVDLQSLISIDDVVDEVALNFLFVADEYLMPKLKVSCTNLLVKRISTRNAANIFISTSVLEVPQLTVVAAIVLLLTIRISGDDDDDDDKSLCRSVLEYIATASPPSA